MAVTSWHSRGIEHDKTKDGGLARASGRAKADGPAPLHPGFQDRTDTSIGAPPTGKPPDASDPNPCDPTTQHGSKQFPIPAVAWGNQSDAERGSYDPASGAGVMGQALVDVTDHTRLGKTALPQSVKEN